MSAPGRAVRSDPVLSRGARARRDQVRKRAPTSAVSPAITAATTRVELRLGQGPLVVADQEPVGQALVAVGEWLAAVDVEQRHAAQERPAVAPDGRLDLRRRDASTGTMTARSRSTVGCRDGAATRYGDG